MEGRSRDEQWLLDVVTRCGISAARASDVALQGAQMLRRLNIKVPVGLFKKGECCRRAVALELASREAGGASLRRDALAFYRISPADIRALEAFEAATAPPEPEVKPLLVLRDYPDLPKAKPAANDDDEDAPAPKKRGPKKQAANEEDAPKKRGPKKKAANEEEDAAPKKRGPKKKAERDDDAPAKKKRGAKAPAEDEAPPAKKRGPPRSAEDGAEAEEEGGEEGGRRGGAAAARKRQRRSSGAPGATPGDAGGAGGRRSSRLPKDKARVAFTCTDDDPVLESQARRAQQLSSAGLVADSAADATVVVVGPRLQPGYVLTDKPRYKVAAECAGAVWIAAAPRKPEGRALLIIDAACSFNDAHLHVQPKDFLLAILRNEDPAKRARHRIRSDEQRKQAS
ncbi:hypothetical protein JL720_11191 [Aureococcus anophagefferens]|nr:hypothetical protein JL720_11191 [Aureococcus anophagefferens]